MFFSMTDKFIMTQWQTFSIFWQKAGHVEIYIVLNQPGMITLQVLVLIIEFLVPTPYELWMM